MESETREHNGVAHESAAQYASARSQRKLNPVRGGSRVRVLWTTPAIRVQKMNRVGGNSRPPRRSVRTAPTSANNGGWRWMSSTRTNPTAHAPSPTPFGAHGCSLHRPPPAHRIPHGFLHPLHDGLAGNERGMGLTRRGDVHLQRPSSARLCASSSRHICAGIRSVYEEM